MRALLALAVASGTLLALAPSGGAGGIVIGRSVRGRPILAIERGDPRSRRRILVVGCIHGNEPAGIAIAGLLERMPLPAGIDLWIVPNLNPDGVAAGTRQNADRVDLNRNFPWGWQRLSGIYDSGPRPLSEPESRAAYRLILRVRPTISIWLHQHLDLVDESGGSIAVERRYAVSVGLPLRRLVRYPGSVTGWEDHRFPGTTAFVVELHAGTLSTAETARFARAALHSAP